MKKSKATDEYIKVKSVLRIIDIVMQDENIKKKGKAIRKRLKELPAVDVEKVVRCKECKNRYVPYRCALWYATSNETEYFIERGDDFSCSYGRKKEGAEK